MIVQVNCKYPICRRARNLLLIKSDMMWRVKTTLKILAGRRFKAALLLGVFLSVLALANSPTLHHLLHANAGNADHQCAVALLASGQVDAPSSAPEIIPATAVFVFSVLPEAPQRAGVSFDLPPGRGPPALLS